MNGELTFEHHQIDYDNQKYLDEFRENTFFESIGPIGKAAYYTLLTGESIQLDFVNFVLHLNKNCNSNEAEVSDDLLIQADNEFNWDKYEFHIEYTGKHRHH